MNRSAKTGVFCAIVALVSLCGYACSKPKSDKQAEPAGPCKEPTRLEFIPSDAEGLPTRDPLVVQSSLAYYSGMRIRGRTTARAGHMAFSNHEIKLGPYKFFSPKDPGHWVLLLSFKSESREVKNEESYDEYRKIPLESGLYDRPGYQDDKKSFQVSFYHGGQKGPTVLSRDSSSGSAQLTVAGPEWFCGSVDFTSEKGSRLKGTFAVKVEKDLWSN